MNSFKRSDMIRVCERMSMPARLDYSRVDALAAEEEDADLLLEAATLEDVELAYIGDELTSEQHNAMFEAISTTRTALARSMQAFSRKLNNAMSSYKITTVTDTPSGDEQTVGGVEISKVRKVAGIPILVARVSLSDGQSVSLVFHSPTSNGSTIAGGDIITVFRFLLNKRDVTHVVAPVNGNDISLNQVCMLMARLIGTNSPKFQRQVSVAQRTREQLNAAVADIDNLEAQQVQLTTQAEQAQLNATAAEAGLVDAQNKLENAATVTAKMTQQRDTLAAQLDNLRTTAAKRSPFSHPQEAYANGYQRAVAGDSNNPPEGLTEELSAAWHEGWEAYSAERELWMGIYGDMTGFVPDANPVQGQARTFEAEQEEKRRKEEEIAAQLKKAAQDEAEEAQRKKTEDNGEEEDHTTALFWYGLRTRAAAPGAVPDGVAATLTVEETAELEIVKRKGFDDQYFRFGAVGYQNALTAEDVDHFSLTDFQHASTPASDLDAAERVKAWFIQLRKDQPDLSFSDIFVNYFKPRGANVDENPIKDRDGNYDPVALQRIMKTAYKTNSMTQILEDWYNQYAPAEKTPEEKKAAAGEIIAPMTEFIKRVLTEKPATQSNVFWSLYLTGPLKKELPDVYQQVGVMLLKFNTAIELLYPSGTTSGSFDRYFKEVRDSLPQIAHTYDREDYLFTASTIEGWLASVRSLPGNLDAATINMLDYLDEKVYEYGDTAAVLQLLNNTIAPGVDNFLKHPANYSSAAAGIVEVAGIYLRNYANGDGSIPNSTGVIPFPFSSTDLSELSDTEISNAIHKMQLIASSLNTVLNAWNTGKLSKNQLGERMGSERNNYTTRWAEFTEEELKSRDSYLALPAASRRGEIGATLQSRVDQFGQQLEWVESEWDVRKMRRRQQQKDFEDREMARKSELATATVAQLNEMLNNRTTDPAEIQTMLQQFVDLSDLLMNNGIFYDYEDLIANVDRHLDMLKANQVDTTPGATQQDEATAAALATVADLTALQSSDMAELRAARTTLRGAIQALQDAGTFAANEDAVNAAARHLGDLLVAIADAGVR